MTLYLIVLKKPIQLMIMLFIHKVDTKYMPSSVKNSTVQQRTARAAAEF